MKHIVFIHGMYMNALSWEGWIDYFTRQGYVCHALSWPFHQAQPQQLRGNVPQGLDDLTFKDLVEYCERYIQKLNLKEPPIIIGHSIGGLLTQVLVGKGLAAAAVSISSAPPLGIFTVSHRFLYSNLPHINPLAGNRPIQMTKRRFKYTFCNTMTQAASDVAFDRYVTPESRNVPRGTLTAAAKIDFKKSHVPLLFIAGDKDNLVPMSLNKKNVKRYGVESGAVELKIFPDRGHFICNQPGWEKVAEYAGSWLKGIPKY